MVNNLSKIKERCLQLAKNKNFSIEEFCEKIDMSYSNFKGKAKNTPLNSSAIATILTIIPDVNLNWLISGEGNMLELKHAQQPTDSSLQQSYIPDKLHEGELIPIYNAEASAGGGALRLEKEFVIGEIKVPFARKGDIALTTVGASMQPVINSGDLLIVRERPNWREYLEPGKMYVVVTEEEVFVKVIASTKTELTLKSYNPEYEDFTVPKEYVCAIFKVIGTISHRSY